jgi:proprotein convertase subtilisin/kexin type 5
VCHIYCKTCDNNNTNQACKECNANYYYSDTTPYKKCGQSCKEIDMYKNESDYKCLTECPHDYFYPNLNNECKPCNLNCIKCSGPNENECSECINNVYKIPILPGSLYACTQNCGTYGQFLYNGVCNINCPSNTFPNTSSYECQGFILNSMSSVLPIMHWIY